MARSPVDPNIPIREALQPQSEIVSTYVRPPDPAPSNLHQLADALTNFSRNIGGMLEKRNKENEANDAIRGKKAALIANGADYGAGVKNGTIMAMDSPAFMAAYKQTQGEIIGKRFASQAASEYLSWDGRNSEDPNNFQQFLGQFMEKNLAGIEDPDVLKGVIPYLENTSSTLMDANTNERNKTIYNNSVDTSIASNAMDLDAQFDLGIANGGNVNYEQMWTDLMDGRSAALEQGVLASDYDAKMYQMIVAKAIEHHDPGILGLLDRNAPGMNVPYSQTPEGAALKKQTVDSFETLWAAETRGKEAAQKAADDAKKDQYTKDSIQRLSADPGTVFSEEYLQDAESVDPLFRIHIAEWREKMGQDEDPSLITGIQQKIMAGQYGYQDLRADMGKGGPISNPATANSLSTLIDRVGGNQKEALTGNDTYKRVAQLIQTTLTDTNIFAAGGMSENAVRADLDFRTSMLEWYEKNPDAGADEIGKQALATWARIKQGISEGGMVGEGGYAPLPSDPSAAVPVTDFANAQPEPGALDAEGKPVPALTPDQQEDPMAVWQQGKAPTYDQLNSQQQATIREMARQQGIPEDLYIKGLYQTLIETDFGKNPNGATGVVEPGNIDLNNRQPVDNGDGSYSTVRSMSFEEDGVEVLIPTVVDGKVVSDEEAIKHYHDTGEHLGKFKTVDAANAYAEQLHQEQEAQYGPPPEAVTYKNNNPGNLKFGDFAKAAGATGADDRGFAIFPDGETGTQAMTKLLFEDPRYKDLTLAEAIAKYAPASDGNDPNNYTNFLSQQTGIQPGDKLSAVPVGERQSLIDAMIRMEGSQQQGPDDVTNTATLKQASVDAGATFSAKGFDAHYATIKGSANYFTSGKHSPPAGDPASAAWQSANTKTFNVTLSSGKKQPLRVYGPAAVAFEGFIKDLQASGYQIDNISGQVVRKKRGSNSLSEHSYGTAIDINGEGPDHNHDKMADIPPKNQFSQKLVTDLPPGISKLAAKWGLSWGGDWKGKKDAMHFEYTGVAPFGTRTASI